MKRGCAFGLFVFAALAVAYDWILESHIESPGHIFASLAGAFFGMMFVSAIIERRRAHRDIRVIRAAETHQAPVDGKMVALIGAITPLGFPLRSPISDTPCVGYEYEVNTNDVVTRQRRRTRQEVRHMSGIALTPSAIGTAAHGSIRLLSFPLLEGFPKARHSDGVSRARVQQFVSSARFETRNVITAIGAFAGALTDNDGMVRVDYTTSGDTELPPNAWFSETVIPAGAMVCAIGRYSADRRGVITEGMTFVRLIAGDADTARKSIAAKSKSQLKMATFLFVVVHGLLGGVTYLSSTRYAHASKERQAQVLADAISRQDTQALELAIARGADPNVMNAAGEPPVQLTIDTGTARTLARLGADINATGGSGRTPLMLAVMRHYPDMAQTWIAAGANIHLARPDGAAALTDAEEGDGSAEDEQIAVMLREAGARCDHVNEANGTPLPPDGGLPLAAVRDYLAAIHSKDRPRLRALSHGRAPGFFETVDFDVWQKTRPIAPRLASGYANPTAATIRLEPHEAMDATIVWTYQLVRTGSGADAGGWRIAREWARRVEAEGAPAGPDAPVEQPRSRSGPDPVERPRR